MHHPDPVFGQFEDIVLAKPNYSFEKRQRDLEKKRKQEEKRMKKLADKKPTDGGEVSDASDESGVGDSSSPAGASE